MEALDEHIIHPITAFVRNSKMLVRMCTKPDKEEYNQSAMVIGMGFIALGFIGYFVKLFFIPINNVILGSN